MNIRVKNENIKERAKNIPLSPALNSPVDNIQVKFNSRKDNNRKATIVPINKDNIVFICVICLKSLLY